MVSWWRERLKVQVSPPELDHVPLCVVEKRGVYRLHGNGCSPRVWPCTWSLVKFDLWHSVNNSDKRNGESSFHYSVLDVMIHNKTEKPVHVQCLVNQGKDIIILFWFYLKDPCVTNLFWLWLDLTSQFCKVMQKFWKEIPVLSLHAKCE